MSSSTQLPFDFRLQNEFVFDNFLTSKANVELLNSLVHSKQPQSQEQFYFIWGEEGSGKSHLFQALCQQRQHSVYLPMKKYISYGAEILHGLEQMELVCIDDIEFMLQDEQWEESLFHFFNAMRGKGHQLLISAANSPRNLTFQLPDLASRLSWGVVYQMHVLEEDEKLEALRLRAKRRGIVLSDEVLNYILLRSSRGMDALFAVLNRMDQLSLIEQRKVTIPFIKKIMSW